jgi:hypothetical protein
MKSRNLCSALTLAATLLSVACASRAVKPQQSYDKLQPIAVLPQTSKEPTLIVQINNVTDEAKSRKNTVELFINDQEIQPSGGKGSSDHNYVYELTLASGVYRIKALYHATSAWKEQLFEIATHDGRVRVYPDYRTQLTATLDKKPDGTLKQKKNFFSETPQSLRPTTTPAVLKPAAPPAEARASAASLPGRNQEQNNQATAQTPTGTTSPDLHQRQSLSGAPKASIVPLAREAEGGQTGPEGSGKIAIQINTTPSHAEVIVDDKYLGQSPLVTYVDRGQNHVIQLSKEGYAGIIKLIDHRELEGQKVYFLIEKFEAQE